MKEYIRYDSHAVWQIFVHSQSSNDHPNQYCNGMDKQQEQHQVPATPPRMTGATKHVT